MRLDNASNVSYGGENVLALWVDAMSGSGWWYEGAGIYRHVQLIQTSSVHVDTFGVFAPASITGPIAPSSASEPFALTADSVLEPNITVANTGSSAAPVCATFVVVDAAGHAVATQMTQAVAVPAGATVHLAASVPVAAANLWALRSPYLYTLVVTLGPECGGSSSGTPYDTLNTTVGFRSLFFDADTGFSMNDQHLQLRGFCNVHAPTENGRKKKKKEKGGGGGRSKEKARKTAQRQLFPEARVFFRSSSSLFFSFVCLFALL